MILTSTRITTSSGRGPLWNHLKKTSENEAVAVLRGSEADLADWIEDARQAGAKFGLRHLTINPAPDEPLTRDQAHAAARAWVREFDGDPEQLALVEHTKKRAGQDQASSHWHAVFPEYDPTRRRVLDSRHDYARTELIARTLETRFGHQPTQGWHNVAVLGMARDRGLQDVAQRCEALTQGDRPNSAFSKDDHQRAKRKGHDLAQIRDEVRAIYQRCGSGEEFRQDVADELGLRIIPGDKAGAWVVADQDGEALGAVHRFAKVRKNEAEAFMRAPTQTKEVQHEPAAERSADRPDRGRAPTDRGESRPDRDQAQPADRGAAEPDAGAGGRERRGQNRPDPRKADGDLARQQPESRSAERDRQHAARDEEQSPFARGRAALRRLLTRSRLRTALRGLDWSEGTPKPTAEHQAEPEQRSGGAKFGGRGGQDLEL